MTREQVIKGLECCLANRHNKCPYKSTDEGIDKVTCCTTYLFRDALALIREQQEEIQRLCDALKPEPPKEEDDGQRTGD